MCSKIERNLDAFSITPRLHRQELLKHVHHPDFQRLCYVTQIEADLLIPSPSLRALGEVVREVALEHESIQQDIIAGISRPLGYQPSITSQHIEWVDQLNRFHQKAKHIYEELGAWAADYFISQTIGILRAKSTLEENLPTKFKEDVSASLLRVLDKRALVLPPEELSARSNLSSKVETLIAFLTSQDSQEHAGLIFVRQRAVVSVLHRILSTHPLMIAHFRCATFVGLSGSSKRTYKVSELLDLKAQQDTMGEFRAGRKNLIIATDVLEEGIDVIACNLVICFDRPPTLKSFIQRRGRARMQRSKFAIMLPLSDAGSEIDYWQELEAELIKTYQDEERARLMAAYAKNQVEEEMNYRLHVPCTGYVIIQRCLSDPDPLPVPR